ncbi:hypothetical protein [Bradyrhizobium sp.]|uniref:hypothetical protein n=1 Tax=Bradyrhizobium sp. TaxID=376 RepID=UPI003C7AE7C1
MSLIDEAEQRQRTRRNVVYLLLLAAQLAGMLIFVWQELPAFEQLLLNPGERLPKDIYSDVMIFGVFCLMQISFWCRVLYVPIPFLRPNLFLNHVFLFFGRLSFVFGGALFAVVVFRHLPRLERDFDVLLAIERGIIFIGCLFALFCTSLEVERLAHAFERNRN